MKAQFEVNGETITINASMETISEIQGMALKAQLYVQGIRKKHPNDEKAADYYRKKHPNDEKAADYYNQWFHGLFDALYEKNYYNN